MGTYRIVPLTRSLAVILLLPVLSLLPLGLAAGLHPATARAAGSAALTPPPAPPPVALVLDAAIRRYGVAGSDLRFAGGAWATFPYLQKSLWHAKVVHRTDGRVLTVALTPSGKPIEYDLVAAQEQTLRNLALDRLDPDLRLVTRALAPDRRVRVAIWLSNPDTQSATAPVLARYLDLSLAPGRRPLPDCSLVRYRAFYQDCLKAKEAAYLANAAPLVDWLACQGQRVTYVCRSAPLVFAEVAVGLLGRLAMRPEVAAVYPSRQYRPELNTASPALKPDWTWSLGLSGEGVAVAVIDAERIDWADPFLAKGLTFSPAGAPGAHATAVAGAIACAHETYRGLAPGVTLLSANAGSWSDEHLVAAADWALAVGAAVFDLGFGADTGLRPQALDRFFDHLAREHGRLAVKSAGNCGGTGDTGNVTSPGLGYNPVTVGGTFDNNTGPYATDDSRYPLSSFRDPPSTHGDRSEPDLSAVAQGIHTTQTQAAFDSGGSWITPQSTPAAGTSYAAALVSGAVALYTEYRPFLAYWPELTRAVLLASAGRTTYGRCSEGRLHDQEGAGTLEVDEGMRLLARDDYALVSGYRQDFPREYPLQLSAGQRVRVALAWLNDPNWPADPSGQRLTADFDLTIYGPTGEYVAGAYTWDNNCELVEFVAPATGAYRTVISATRLDTPYEHLGLAWSIR
ncbi:MAG: S8 family serine peptidase [Acetobacteraceae bacterium]|nr:S8 family serine peptidase [Acetobacteraceae bacterium]